MTGGRKKSGRKSASTPKKESCEKRRSSRRRGHRSRSEPDDSGSDVSAETSQNAVERPITAVENSENVRGEESGGSDGAWHVRSENGNKGGIPKLKLCLQRPAEIASPTNETIPSPRSRKSRRGVSPIVDPAESSLENHTVAIESSEDAKDTQVQVENTDETPVDSSLKQCNDDEKQAKEPTDEPVVTTVEPDKESPDSTEVSIIEVKRKSVEEPEKLTRRSSSRDSSEERAKEEALKSRKSKKSGSEESNAVESSESNLPFPSRTGGRIRTTGLNAEETMDVGATPEEVTMPVVRKRRWGSSNATPEEVTMPVVRKRRWGSSNVRAAKKPSVSISTDVLKEIIPEAKPVSLSEVHLSPNKEEDKETDDTEPTQRRRSRSDDERRNSRSEERLNTNSIGERKKRTNVPSDESEKDYEEEAVDSGGEEMVKKEAPNQNEKSAEETVINEKPHPVRKVAVVDPLSVLNKQRSPSPSANPVSNILYVMGLVRPFTVAQLRDLLARTGNIVEDGFWIDNIKSHCYVKYATEEEAKTTRHALHGIRWPASNPKTLHVDFGTNEALKTAFEGGRTVTSVRDRDKSSNKRIVVEEKTRDGESRNKEREKRRHEDEEERKVKLGNSRDRPERTVRKVTTIPVREWDLGKAERGFSPPPIKFEERREREQDDRRKRDKERTRRSSSNEPVRKVKRKGEDAPNKIMLEDLFRKTKASPSIYWLPLTTEQIAVKEELRRKHMAEHEKRLAEQRKRHEAKRRKPRTKSRSRSRSPKK